VALFITLNMLGDVTAASFAGFGTIGLLMTADYAGSARQRTVDYLVTGVICSGLIMLGLVASGNVVTAALTTFVVALVTSLAGMLRGNIAGGAPAAILPFIVAVCIGLQGTTITDALVAWWVAVIVCTVVALVVFPRRREHIARGLLADVIDRSADMAQATWLQPLDPARVRSLAASLDDVLDQLRGVHAGKPFRPTGVTREDRALSLLIDHAWGMREVVRDPELQERPTEGTGPAAAAARSLAQAIVDTQRASAAALRHASSVPSVETLTGARNAYREAVVTETVARANGGVPAGRLAEDAAYRHLISMASVIVEQSTQLVREANGDRVEKVQGAISVPQRSIGTFLRSQLSLDSGWLRNALRTAIGLSVAMLIVSVTDIQKGFWVLFGVIAVLRFDSFTTKRNAWQALLGTVFGVIVATIIISLAGNNLTLMWILLPITVFIAGWSAVVLNYPVAQASFSGFILIMVAITRWPPDLLMGGIRIVDIALGSAIALVVALVLWPQGALGALHQAMSQSVRVAWGYAATVARSYASPINPQQAHDTLSQARRAILVGAEAYDVALMQRGPGMPRFAGWLALTGDSYLLVNVGQAMAPFSSEQLPAGWSPSLRALVQERVADGDAYWDDIADHIAIGDVASWHPSPHGASWSSLSEVPTTHDEALGFVITIWLLDWFDRIDGIRAGAREPDAATAASS